MRARYCTQCPNPLKPTEQGTLCSQCYYGIITAPGLADPPRPVPQVSTGRDSRAH